MDILMSPRNTLTLLRSPKRMVPSEVGVPLGEHSSGKNSMSPDDLTRGAAALSTMEASEKSQLAGESHMGPSENGSKVCPYLISLP